MALQTSGAISLSDIQTEFGGSNPISLSEYYRGGGLVTSNNTNVPTSGQIQLDDFYGAINEFVFTITSNQQELNLSTYATSLGWDGTAPIAATIASGVYIWSDNTSTAGLIIPSNLSNLLTITNNGYIIGRGGNGAYGSYGNGSAGGPAISNAATGVTFENNSGAFIAGGGGGGAATTCGGGGGAGGGVGGGSTATASDGAVWVGYGGTGGAAGATGGKGTGNSWRSTVRSGYGGGSGGGGGGTASDYGGTYNGSGGGGGRILAGVGGAYQPTGTEGIVTLGSAPAGGSANNNGGNGTHSGGGGGWGASGGSVGGYSGGAGGAAITGTSIASMTNNGTIYGSQA